MERLSISSHQAQVAVTAWALKADIKPLSLLPAWLLGLEVPTLHLPIELLYLQQGTCRHHRGAESNPFDNLLLPIQLVHGTHNHPQGSETAPHRRIGSRFELGVLHQGKRTGQNWTDIQA